MKGTKKSVYISYVFSFASKFFVFFVVFLLSSVSVFVSSGTDDYYEHHDMDDGDAFFYGYHSRGVTAYGEKMAIRFQYDLIFYEPLEYEDPDSLDFFEQITFVFHEYQEVNDFSEIDYDTKVNELNITREMVEESIDQKYPMEYGDGYIFTIRDHVYVDGILRTEYTIMAEYDVFNNIDIEDSLATWEQRRELRGDQDGYTPIEINVQFNETSGMENGNFASEESAAVWPPIVLAYDAFMEEVLSIATLLTVAAGSVGAIALIFMAYKWMNPLLDPEEKKKIREDAMRWVVGLSIVFSARLVAAIFEYIGSGTVTIMVVVP